MRQTALLRGGDGLGSAAMVASSEKCLFDAISPTFRSYKDCCQPKADGYRPRIFDNHCVNEFAFDQFQKPDVDMTNGLIKVHLNCCDQFYPVTIGKLPNQSAYLSLAFRLIKVNLLGSRRRRHNQF
jgi:hypothetical protein